MVLVVKNPSANKRRGFNLWVRKFPWKRAWQPTPVFLLRNPMDREAWQATVYRVTKSQTRLSMHIYNKVMIQIVFPDIRRMRSELKETETSKNLGEEYQIESKTQRTHSRKLHRGHLASLDKF